MDASAVQNPSTDSGAETAAADMKIDSIVANAMQHIPADATYKAAERYSATWLQGADEAANAAFREERADKEAAIAAMDSMSLFLAGIGLAEEYEEWVRAGMRVNADGEFEPIDGPEVDQARGKIAADVRMRISPSMI